MPKRKPVAIEPTPVELSVADEINAELSEMSEDWLAILKKIAYYVSRVGLSLEEACILADTTYARFQVVAQMHPVIGKIIQKKMLENKKELLKTLSDKARKGDEKIAQWLLAKNFPEEYGARPRTPDESSANMVASAIKFVQRSSEENPLIKESAGQAIVIQGKEEDVTKTLRDMLA